ncbi:hypothetical protein B0H13DRAFT_2350076 [Mycena leptocephala]|nr:hypothetical protein B0H13DRAFT_2350076 [Mycena leptocephala]
MLLTPTDYSGFRSSVVDPLCHADIGEPRSEVWTYFRGEPARSCSFDSGFFMVGLGVSEAKVKECGGHGGTGEGPKFDIRPSNVTLTDPHAIKLQFIKEKLAGHVAAQHKFTDKSKSLCAPDTRVDIQAELMRWLSPQPSNRERIFWITGIAGSGKSTLSATIVDNLHKNHTPVAAQFFISREIPETVDPSKIIPTIAKQLAEFSPAAAGIIHNVLERGFPPTRKKQVEELLLAPIRNSADPVAWSSFSLMHWTSSGMLLRA